MAFHNSLSQKLWTINFINHEHKIYNQRLKSQILSNSNLRMVERNLHLASGYKRKMIHTINGKFSIWQIYVQNKNRMKREKKTKPRNSFNSRGLEWWARKESNLRPTA